MHYKAFYARDSIILEKSLSLIMELMRFVHIAPHCRIWWVILGKEKSQSAEN